MAEITKRKKGQMLNNNERQLILNLMTYLRARNSEKSVSEIIREISKATGCSERTIYKIKKEASKGIIVATTRTRLRKKVNKNSRNVKYDSFVKSSIRKIIRNYFVQNISSPSLNRILRLVNSDPNLPNFKRSTFHTLLKEIGFVYQQKGRKPILTESNDSIQSRQAYLRDMRKFRSENRRIVYTGETVFSLMKKDLDKDVLLTTPRTVIREGETLQMACQEVSAVLIDAADLISGTTLVYTIDADALENVVETENVQLNEEAIVVEEMAPNLASTLSQGVMADEDDAVSRPCRSLVDKPVGDGCQHRQKSGRELRLTIMHAGSNEGFIQDAEFIVLSRKKAEDAENYRHWFLEKLLPKIPANSVVVTDNNTAYHGVEENCPDSTWKKKQIKNWLLSKSVKVEHLKQKKELLSVVNEMCPMYSTKCKVHEMARERGIIILSLPPFHYELNPLNMIWAQIKYHVKSNMKSFKANKIKKLIREGIYSISQVSWMNYVDNVKEIEDLLWTVDEAQKRREDYITTHQAAAQEGTKIPDINTL